MNRYYAPSELPINDDGSCFHLHLRPEHLADKVILVGDPGRVNLVAKYFDSIESENSNREFHTITGTYKGKRITAQSTGIGCDNIDIVVNELDALANINFTTRTDNTDHRTLDIVRIGTCGGLQPEASIGTPIISVNSIGFDGLLNYYANRDSVCDIEMEKAFTRHMVWNPRKGAPYVAIANKELVDRISPVGEGAMLRGITIACGGFYGPQGRRLRLEIDDPDQNAKVESFTYNGLKICNFEMESSAVAGLSALLGHRATTCCLVIANRYNKEMNTDYKPLIAELIENVLDKI